MLVIAAGGDVLNEYWSRVPDNTVPEEQDSYKKRLEGLGVDQEKVRIYNRQLILRYLREHGPEPRGAISQSLDPSRYRQQYRQGPYGSRVCSRR